MSERRAARGPGGATPALPEYLTWAGADDERWWDSDVPPHGMARFMAHRRHRAARRAYLASLGVKPIGVRDREWAEAHRKYEA